MNRILMCIGLVGLVAAPGVALAQPPASADRIVVSHSDLDLTRDSDVRQLDLRIRLALVQACGPTSDIDLKGKNEARRCRAATRQRVAVQRARAIASASQPAQLASHRRAD